NRAPTLVISDSAAVIARADLPNVVPATQVAPIAWARGMARNASTDIQAALTGALPELVLPAGTTLASLTRNFQVGDQWSAVQFSVVELQANLILAQRDWIAKNYR